MINQKSKSGVALIDRDLMPLSLMYSTPFPLKNDEKTHTITASPSTGTTTHVAHKPEDKDLDVDDA